MCMFVYKSRFLLIHLRADLGAAYGTAKSGVGISSMGVMKVCCAPCAACREMNRLGSNLALSRSRIACVSTVKPSLLSCLLEFSVFDWHVLISAALFLPSLQPDLVMRNIIPVVMAGVLGIYGLIVAVVLIQAGTM
jgi:hypothetical protein